MILSHSPSLNTGNAKLINLSKVVNTNGASNTNSGNIDVNSV